MTEPTWQDVVARLENVRRWFLRVEPDLNPPSVADGIALIERQAREIEALRDALNDWNNTPGNERTHAWWISWHQKKDTALAASKPE